ncbi:cell division protein FtsQ/DivIB [Streptomyces sp. PU-14G]|uniref:cell division protein FtsQ/DivIB n=1 Tax=Streptomyces sp. PU-14G TaxID=2800808 RepID=UPI0034DE2937
MVRAARTAKAAQQEQASGTAEAGAARPRARTATAEGGRAGARPAPGARARGTTASGSGSGCGPGPGRGEGSQRPPRWARLGARVPRRRTLVLTLALVLPLGGFGTWALYGSPWLRAESVSVDGIRALTRSEVTRAAAVPLGEPLISVDKGAVQRRVRAALPRVREVAAERTWPHGIALTVTERRPELVMEKAGKYVEVDAEGVRFATEDKPPKGVPLLAVEPKKDAAERYFSARRLRKEAARVATSLPDAVQDATRLVKVRSYDDITVRLTGDRTVRWGSAERGKAKATALTALMKAAEDATHFDVTVPSAPAASGG